MAPRRLAGLYAAAIERLSFSGELYKLRRDLNSRIDQPETIEPDYKSHPLGVARWFKKRRISIAEAYLTVVRDLDSRHARLRLRALRSMIDASFHTQALDMPLNAARVQMALMKEAVKSRGNRRRQLELLQDFSASSRGRRRTIRRLLDELDLVELPEEGKRLEELGPSVAGFDTHVHDTGTSGRKNPTQLLIDAFIKGMSEITVAYTGSAAASMMEEALEAGRIVGIRVRIGIEVGLDFEGFRFHFMALLPPMRRAKELRRFFEKNRHALKPLLEGLEEDQEARLEAIKRGLAAFNETELKALNAGFPDEPHYRLPKLRMRDLEAIVPASSASRAHLGELLWRKYRSIMLNRVLYLKVKRGRAQRDYRDGLVSRTAMEAAELRYASARSEYRSMSPDALRRRFFPDPQAADHTSAFDDLPKLRKALTRAECGLRLIHPLEHGLEAATRLLEAHGNILDEVEVYNAHDCFGRGEAEIASLCSLVDGLGARGAAPSAVVGSDATGRDPAIPGMGFVLSERRAGSYRERYERRHGRLPEAVSRIVLGASRQPAGASAAGRGIVFMGKSSKPAENLVGDEEDSPQAAIPLRRALRYLNPAFVGIVIAAIGFSVAQAFIGPAYALLWLAITGTRVALSDLFAYRGPAVRRWNPKSVDWPNVAQAMFWTGFSVPIMGFIKARFDWAWPLVTGAESSGLAFNAAKFFFIAFANGLYIASHNALRGFDRRVIRANLFRTIISWPFATAFAPLGDLAGIPSIVQSKIWSDVVAGFIEGGQKYFNALRLRRRDVEEIVPRILRAKGRGRVLATLDLLYLFRDDPRTRNSLRSTLLSRAAAKEGEEGLLARLEAAVSDSGLDDRLLGQILSMYSGEAAVDLAGLVASTLPEMRDWIAGLASRRPPGKPSAKVAQAEPPSAAKPDGSKAR
jgi:hypothetical protein